MRTVLVFFTAAVGAFALVVAFRIAMQEIRRHAAPPRPAAEEAGRVGAAVSVVLILVVIGVVALTLPWILITP